MQIVDGSLLTVGGIGEIKLDPIEIIKMYYIYLNFVLVQS